MRFHSRPVESDGELLDLDRLLWNVLWKPLGFPRDIRENFKLSGPQFDLVAVDDVGEVIGGLVANRISEGTVEIRHIAVRSDWQRRSVGSNLFMTLLEEIEKPVTLQTRARNSSTQFFRGLGFHPTGEQFNHPEFSKHGIGFHLLRMEVT